MVSWGSPGMVSDGAWAPGNATILPYLLSFHLLTVELMQHRDLCWLQLRAV